MKGPGHRKYQIKRVWECPVCGRQERTSGQIVNCICSCRGESPPGFTWMQLKEELQNQAKATPGRDPEPGVSTEPVDAPSPPEH